MIKFDYGDIPINSELEGKNQLNSSLEKIEKQKTTRRKFLIGTATLALSLSVPKETSVSSTLFKKTLEYFKSSPDDILENKGEKNKITPEKKKIKPPQEKESPMDIESLAYKIQEISRQLLKDDKFLPQELFGENFFAAVQIQESGLKRDAQSNAGAIGIMQVRPITVKEVVRYLNILEKDGIVSFDGPLADELSEKNINDLLILIKGNGSLGKAFGKLYFADLFNNFEIGKEMFLKKDIFQARKKILAAYNWNPDNFKRNENRENNWPPETKEYYNKVLENITSLEIIQKEIAALQMKTDLQDLSILLTIELNRYENVSPKDPLFKKLIQSYLKRINAIEIVNARPLKYTEIKSLMDRFNPLSYRLYANHKIKEPH